MYSVSCSAAVYKVFVSTIDYALMTWLPWTTHDAKYKNRGVVAIFPSNSEVPLWLQGTATARMQAPLTRKIASLQSFWKYSAVSLFWSLFSANYSLCAYFVVYLFPFYISCFLRLRIFSCICLVVQVSRYQNWRLLWYLSVFVDLFSLCSQ